VGDLPIVHFAVLGKGCGREIPSRTPLDLGRENEMFGSGQRQVHQPRSAGGGTVDLATSALKPIPVERSTKRMERRRDLMFRRTLRKGGGGQGTTTQY